MRRINFNGNSTSEPGLKYGGPQRQHDFLFKVQNIFLLVALFFVLKLFFDFARCSAFLSRKIYFQTFFFSPREFIFKRNFFTRKIFFSVAKFIFERNFFYKENFFFGSEIYFPPKKLFFKRNLFFNDIFLLAKLFVYH